MTAIASHARRKTPSPESIERKIGRDAVNASDYLASDASIARTKTLGLRTSDVQRLNV